MWNERYGEGLTLRLTGGLQRLTELNRRLGDGVKGDWALVRCGAAGDYGRGCGGKQALCAQRPESQAAGQQLGCASGARGG